MNMNRHQLKSAPWGQNIDMETSNSKTSDTQSERSKRLARDLEEFVDRGMKGILATEKGEEGAPSIEAATELQIQIARMFRQIFPGNTELLHLVKEKNWMALLLSWMKQYDRPSVQVEAMLTLTTITDLYQQQFYQNSSGVELAPFPNVGLDAMNKPFSSARKPTSKTPMKQNETKIQKVKPKKVQDSNDGDKKDSFLLKEKLRKSLANGNFSKKGSSSDVNSILKEAISQTSSDVNSSINELLKKEALKFSGSHHEKEELMKVVDKSADNADEVDDVEVDMESDSDSQNDDVLESLLKNGSDDFVDMIKKRMNQQSSLTPSMLSALKKSDKNSQIPLVGKYTQPLSVTSNNLLVRHPEAIPSFISLLSSPDKDVCENSMWILGNIATGEGSGIPGTGSNPSSTPSLNDVNEKAPNVTVKDIVLAAGAMGPLLRCMERFADEISLQRIGSWVISTFVETKVSPGKKANPNSESIRLEEIDLEELLPTLMRLLQIDDDDILSYTCWSLSHLCDGPASNISAVVTTKNSDDPQGGLVPRLVELLHHSNWKVTKPALRTIGNIVCAEYDEDSLAVDERPLLADFTEVILDCDAVPKLKSLINHKYREIQKEACWTLSNIAAGTVEQIQSVIDSGAIPLLVDLVNNKNVDQEVKSEACWVVLNATSCGSDQQIYSEKKENLVSLGCVSVLGLLLEETNMVTMALEGLERVLQVEEAKELEWRQRQKRIKDGRNVEPPKSFVTAALIEKAVKGNHKTNVLKRAKKIWNDHFVACALCNESYSKHRVAEAKFCEECKCHVCHKCNCEVYHLSYQEELWATPDEKKGSKSKKSKNKKKKEKRKEKNKQKENEKLEQETAEVLKPDTGHEEEESKDIVQTESNATTSNVQSIDFNLYLQETRSIIAVSRLMDALDQLHDMKKTVPDQKAQ